MCIFFFKSKARHTHTGILNEPASLDCKLGGATLAICHRCHQTLWTKGIVTRAKLRESREQIENFSSTLLNLDANFASADDGTRPEICARVPVQA